MTRACCAATAWVASLRVRFPDFFAHRSRRSRASSRRVSSAVASATAARATPASAGDRQIELEEQIAGGYAVAFAHGDAGHRAIGTHREGGLFEGADLTDRMPGLREASGLHRRYAHQRGGWAAWCVVGPLHAVSHSASQSRPRRPPRGEPSMSYPLGEPCRAEPISRVGRAALDARASGLGAGRWSCD